MPGRWRSPKYTQPHITGEALVRELTKSKRVQEFKETELMNLETYVQQHLDKHPLSSTKVRIHTRVYLNKFNQLNNLSLQKRGEDHIQYEEGFARVAHKTYEGEEEYMEQLFASIFGWYNKGFHTVFKNEKQVDVKQVFSNLFDFVMQYNFPLLFEQVEHPYTTGKYINLVNGFNTQSARAKDFKILEK